MIRTRIAHSSNAPYPPPSVATLRIATAGSVDDGKSTLIGRLAARHQDGVRRSARRGREGQPALRRRRAQPRAADRRPACRARAGHHHRRRPSLLRHAAAQLHRRRHARPRAVHAQHGHRGIDRRCRHRARRRPPRRGRADPPARVHRLAARRARPSRSPSTRWTSSIGTRASSTPSPRISPGTSRRCRRRCRSSPSRSARCTATTSSTRRREHRRGTTARRCSSWLETFDASGGVERGARLDVQRVIRPQGSDFRGFAGPARGWQSCARRRGHRDAERAHQHRVGHPAVRSRRSSSLRPARRSPCRWTTTSTSPAATSWSSASSRRTETVSGHVCWMIDQPLRAGSALLVQARHARRPRRRRRRGVPPRPAHARADCRRSEIELNDLAMVRLSLSEPIVAVAVRDQSRGWSADPRRRSDQHHRRRDDDHGGCMISSASALVRATRSCLTVRGLRRLQEADVVVHDALVGTGVLALASADAEMIDVGKRPGAPVPQELINELLMQLGRERPQHRPPEGRRPVRVRTRRRRSSCAGPRQVSTSRSCRVSRRSSLRRPPPAFR